MIFGRTLLDSTFASAAAMATAALVATATAAIATDSDVGFAASTPASEGDINGIYVPQKISDKQGVVVENFHSVGKEDIELSLNLENHINEKTTTGTTRRLRNNRKLFNGGVGDNDKPVDSNTIDLGILDKMVPTNTKVDEQNRNLADVDYCYKICGPDEYRTVIDPVGKDDVKKLVEYCETPGKCDCDGDDIDYRCRSQIKCWKTSDVTTLLGAFSNLDDFNEPLRCWDVSSVTNMNFAFAYTKAFNQALDSWNVSKVNVMYDMFKSSVFNSHINNWDVSNVSGMRRMFSDAEEFNQAIGLWNVSSVINMQYMFNSSAKFNQPLQSWDVSSVQIAQGLFQNTLAFNQPLDTWDLSFLGRNALRNGFYNASSFNQCLSTWSNQVDEGTNLFEFSGCPYQPPFPLSESITPLCQGPDQQCYATSCEDDPSFRFEDDDLQDCEWVGAEDSNNRCAKERVFEACSKTCNPVCSGILCADDPDFRLNGVKAKNCEWVAKQKTEERCKKPGVMEACTLTCSPHPECAPRTDCTDDYDFRLNGIKGKSCEWVAKQKTDKRCEKPGVMDSCRRTCNPICGCRESTDKFVFQGSLITCEDLDIIYCDADIDDHFTSSDDDFFAKLEVALTPIHQQLKVINEGAVVPKSFRDLCPKKCKKCVD
jgi:hypothetical protein